MRSPQPQPQPQPHPHPHPRSVCATVAGDRLDARFRSVAAREPDRTAVTDAQGSVTYGRLAQQADAVTRALLGRVAPGQPVALRAGRSRHALAGLLGILGAGASYLPVDPGYPQERQRHLLDDSGARLVLTEGPPAPGETLLAEPGPLVLVSRPPASDAVGAPVLPADTAYTIYTSGSTGAPKGCVVGHAQVLALLDAAVPRFDVKAEDVWTLFHSWSFDFSVWEIWGALLYGGRAVIVDRETAADPEAFAALLAAERVTVLNQVPSAFGNLVTEAAADGVRLPALRHVVLGGEALVPDDIRRWWDAGTAPAAAVTNMYGITETTVHVTHCAVTPEVLCEAGPGRTPIGRPLGHLTVELRDEQGELVAPGQPGELWVGGAGVSHGYLGRPGLTAERFPAAPDGTGRRYRSGDWAVADADGRLYYAGRMDGQVKLRGFRIELGEIEAELRALPGVDGAACLVDDSGRTPVLGACLVADREVLPPDRVREHLAERLPAHMLPQRLRYLDRLPLTPHGKLDRTALVAASGAGPRGGDALDPAARGGDHRAG
ncbi:amino acid adenylation domain-containing protein [Streptomyces sp. NBC_01275]|uniref:amino acid adenylation domain-containing protein n=1 Tax=Streptomyces sp. NBC_01275 TaxID=2903807 RepID=UPI00225413C4|nr:amino acid adenylation domain-containing protein [Streptomyces sp. NBC_01275]MCX4766712.1 amino acid adenylation domain-containing protein [Streptomyces sp. NBC_01275]